MELRLIMILSMAQFGLVLLSIIAFILILGAIIVIHEGGHFLLAKRAGILCHEFSLGMGPVIYKKQFGETTFCIRAIPIGGFVSMAGEDVADDIVKVGSKIGINIEDDVITEIILDDNRDCYLRGEVESLDLKGLGDEPLFITLNDGFQSHYYTVKRDAFYVFEKNKRLQITPYDRTFDSKSLWNRFLTIFAGPFMNLVLAMLLYIVVAMANGVPNLESNVVGSVDSNLPASSVLMANDKIIAVDGNKTDTWEEFSSELHKIYENNSTTINLTIDRNGEIKEVTMEAITYIASIGVSNIQANTQTLIDVPGHEGVKGLELGNLAVRYKDKEGNLKSGDIITKVKIGSDEAIEITSWGQLSSIFKDLNVADVRFEYYSKGEADSYTLVTIDECKVIEPYTNEVLNNQRIAKIQQLIGVSPEYHFDFLGCMANSGKMFWSDFTLIFRTLKLLIAPSDVRQVGVKDMSSFVGIFSMIQSFVMAGFIPLLAFTALLSVNIGVMNLLPIPALDGGRLVFLLYELITRRKPNKKVEATINNVFFILLMIFFLYVTFNDILRLF